jgi:hypothetical protein
MAEQESKNTKYTEIKTPTKSNIPAQKPHEEIPSEIRKKAEKLLRGAGKTVLLRQIMREKDNS